ncbi:MAG: VOC family protein [Actinomycetota bacterium]
MSTTSQDAAAGQWTGTSTLIDHIQRVDLRVQDVDRSLRFYRGVVGLEVAEQDGGHAVVRAPGGPVLLTLDSTGVTRPAVRRATGLFHTAIRFPDRPSLADALARLADAGLQIGGGDHAVSEALYIDDPDGNGVELYRDRPRAEWPGPVLGARIPMTTEAVDFAGLYAEGRAGDAVGDRAPEGTDIGHVHLRVSSHAATRAFYADALGLDVIADIGSAGFYSSGGYHHHIGANTWESLGAGPSPADRAGLARMVFAVRGEGELGALRERLAAAGADVPDSDGEIVVRDPDGIELRFVLMG